MSHDGDKPAVATMALTFDPAGFQLRVDFKGPNVECALAMLAQATRWFEAQLRAAQALQIQADMRRQAEDAAIAASLRNPAGGMPRGPNRQ
jgi:hypothetical protein